MASPRTMFSGTLQLSALISIPITIGKATGDDREHSLIDVCVHDGEGQYISRAEYCKTCKGRPANKHQAVKLEDGRIHVLTEADLEQIDEADGGATIRLVDVQPASELPLLYSLGAYYVRHNDGLKGVEADALATLAAAMMVERLCLVVKWKRKLCVLSAERGILVLRVLPYKENVRAASKKEGAHMKAKVDARAVTKLSELLRELSNPAGFDYAAQQDEGLKRRQAVVDRITRGEKPPRKAPPKRDQEPVDFEKLIDQAIADVRG